MFKLDIIAVSIAFIACTRGTPPPLVPQVQAGPAMAVRPNRVLVLHASCGSVEYPCPDEFAQTVDAIVRGDLEFAGFGVVDSETLRDQTRQRHEEHEHVTTSDSSATHADLEKDWSPFDEHTTTRNDARHDSETTKIELDGPGFDDLTIDARHEVMDKSGADSVVSVRIVVGGQIGVWVPDQTVEVMVKLGVNQGDTMAWASRCSASSNAFSTVTAALENAARCAIRGATAR